MQRVGCGSTEENITWGKNSKKWWKGSWQSAAKEQRIREDENILFPPLNEKHFRGLCRFFLHQHGIEKLTLWQDTAAPISAPPYWSHRLSPTTVLLNLHFKQKYVQIPIIIKISLVHSDLQFFLIANTLSPIPKSLIQFSIYCTSQQKFHYSAQV